MKLILTLLSCCIVASWQQNNPPHSNWDLFNHPSELQHHRNPIFHPYFPANPGSYYYPQEDPYHDPHYYSHLANYHHYFYPAAPVADEEDVGSSSSNEKEATFRTYIPKYLLAAQVYNRYTSYSVTTTTITTTTYQPCIPAGSFFGGSSQACRRRRANKAELLLSSSDADQADGTLVHPTPVASIEATSAVSHHGIQSDGDDSIPHQAELNSSQDGNNRARSLFGFPWSLLFGNRGRYGYGGNYGYIYGATTTSTLTSYSFASVVSRTTVTSLGSNLSCLPTGYSVC